MTIKILIILSITLLTQSCSMFSPYSVKVDGTKCTAIGVCSTIKYRSKKDHEQGVSVKYGELEFNSNSSVAKDSAMEKAVANGLTTSLELLKLLQLPKKVTDNE